VVKVTKASLKRVDPDYLVSAGEVTLSARRVDLAERVERLLVGDAFCLRAPATVAVLTFHLGHWPLVYQSHADLAQLVWFDKSGRNVGRIDPEGDYVRSVRILIAAQALENVRK